jgi:membrane-bound lytic murein transglycosylase B
MITACSTKKIDKPIDNNTTINALMSAIQTDNKEPIALTIQTNDDNDTSTDTSTDTTIGINGDFSGNYKLMEFIDYMHNAYQFKHEELYTLFSGAKDINQFVEPYKAPSSRPVKKGKWDRYKGMFVYERNIQRGLDFWEEHEHTLNRAYSKYGVPPEYIVGIIGIETAYGVNFGKKKVIDVLTSKAMLNDRRERFYTKQLEKFLIMTRQAGLNASELMGSNAGAMGYGQFIASSYLSFAVDFNNDGITDLWNAQDAIGSVANYFSRNGWKRSISQVAVRAKYRGNRFKRLKTGYKTKYSQYKLRKKHKITPRTKLRYKGSVSLIKLPRATYDELWFGTHNFRVITTYNHSTFYGMAVFQLGEAVRKRRYSQ